MGKYLVTGACGGMGAAVCKALTASGNEVRGIDRTIRENDENDRLRLVRADVTNTEELAAAFEEIQAESVELDGIVHTAGIYDLASLAEMEEERFLRDVDVNLNGVFRVNRTFLPLDSRDGHRSAAEGLLRVPHH